MSTHTDRGPYEREYDAAVEMLEQAEAVYDAAAEGSEEEAAALEALAAAERRRDAARDAYAESDEPRDYELSDGGGGTETVRCEPDELRDTWHDWMSRGEWGDTEQTTYVHGRATDTLTDQTHFYTYRIEPDEPICDSETHDWQSPYSVLGGVRENPGVWGHGGGVIIRQVCAHCGQYRVTDTWAQDPQTGRQGLRSVRYQEADEASEAYTRRRSG